MHISQNPGSISPCTCMSTLGYHFFCQWHYVVTTAAESSYVNSNLEDKGFTQTSTGYWVKFFKNGTMIQFLHCVDDILCASDNEQEREAFLVRLCLKFKAGIKPRADLCLQTRLQQDAKGNVTLDQTRYAKSVVKHFLPNFVNEEVTLKGERKCASLVKAGTLFSKEDKSKNN